MTPICCRSRNTKLTGFCSRSLCYNSHEGQCPLNLLYCLGVDDAVLKCESKETVIEMMNGCICCTVRADLTKVLAKLAPRIERDNIDAVIIETTGLADPAPVAQTFFVDPTIEKRYFLDGIITMVDTKHIIPHLLKKVAEGAENEAVEQVAFADRIILNKMDLVTEADAKKVIAEIKKINAGVEIIRATNSVVPAHKLFKISAFNLEEVIKMDPEFLDTDAEHEHDQTVGSVSWRMVAEFNVNKLQVCQDCFLLINCISYSV